MSETTDTPRFAGQAITLGGTVYTVPPLGLRALREFLPKIQAMQVNAAGTPSTLADLDVVLELALAALRRNYPDLTRDALEELVDISNFGPLSLAVFNASGLTKTDGPEGNGVPPSAGG